MVQRQEAVKAIVRGDFQADAHHVTGHQPAPVADVRCLGQACGARGKNVHRRVACGDARTPLGGRVGVCGLLRQRLQVVAAQAACSLVGRAVGIGPQPVVQACWQVLGTVGEVLQALFTHHHVRGTRDLQGMAQGFAVDVGVQERHLRPHLVQPPPGEKERGTVFHGQGHHVTRAHTQGACGMGNLVGAAVHVLVAVLRCPFQQ